MLTSFDKSLLNIIQTDLPLASRPFAIVAERLGATEDIVLERLQLLKKHGFIRRIGPFFDSHQLGYVGTLVAIKVNPQRIKDVAMVINSYPGITHNYEREGNFNLWFALLSPDPTAQERVLNQISRLEGVERLISLPATKKFKVSVQFMLD